MGPPPPPPSRPPKFRDSKLTRLLEDSLAPKAESERRNRESVSVMVVNVSPAGGLEKMTVNTLRYGQMYASGGGKATSSVRGKVAARPRTATGKANNAAQEQDVSVTEVRAELERIYAKYCPEKSMEDVARIIAKFAGREV